MNEKERKTIFISVIAISAFAVIAIITKLLTGFTDEDKLEKSLSSLGNLYYQSVFYPSLADPDNGYAFLKSYEETGYKVNLKTMLISTTVDENIFVIKDQKCNLEDTYVLLYPQEPFGQKDIKIKAFLSCGNEG